MAGSSKSAIIGMRWTLGLHGTRLGIASSIGNFADVGCFITDLSLMMSPGLVVIDSSAPDPALVIRSRRASSL